MGTGIPSPDLDFPSLNGAGSPESVRIGGAFCCCFFFFQKGGGETGPVTFLVPSLSSPAALCLCGMPMAIELQAERLNQEASAISRGVSRPVLSRPVTA